MPDRPDRIHLMVRQMILIRLDQAAPHKEAVRRGLAILAVPGNALASARALYATVDAIWRAAGQTDTDISFYTKRATLAAVYSATLLAWIADTSGDPAVVEGFLDRRLRDVAQIPKATGPLRGAVSAGQRLAEGMFQMVGRVRRWPFFSLTGLQAEEPNSRVELADLSIRWCLACLLRYKAGPDGTPANRDTRPACPSRCQTICQPSKTCLPSRSM